MGCNRGDFPSNLRYPVFVVGTLDGLIDETARVTRNKASDEGRAYADFWEVILFARRGVQGTVSVGRPAGPSATHGAAALGPSACLRGVRRALLSPGQPARPDGTLPGLEGRASASFYEASESPRDWALLRTIGASWSEDLGKKLN
jgi:hypothetical protein